MDSSLPLNPNFTLKDNEGKWELGPAFVLDVSLNGLTSFFFDLCLSVAKTPNLSGKKWYVVRTPAIYPASCKLWIFSSCDEKNNLVIFIPILYFIVFLYSFCLVYEVSFGSAYCAKVGLQIFALAPCLTNIATSLHLQLWLLLAF